VGGILVLMTFVENKCNCTFFYYIREIVYLFEYRLFSLYNYKSASKAEIIPM
jgi:hypothetical protein